LELQESEKAHSISSDLQIGANKTNKLNSRVFF